MELDLFEHINHDIFICNISVINGGVPWCCFVRAETVTGASGQATVKLGTGNLRCPLWSHVGQHAGIDHVPHPASESTLCYGLLVPLTSYHTWDRENKKPIKSKLKVCFLSSLLCLRLGYCYIVLSLHLATWWKQGEDYSCVPLAASGEREKEKSSPQILL